MKRALTASLCLLAIAASAYTAQHYFIGEDEAERPLNVIVVSACSLRKDRLGIDLSPKINAWARGAFVFENAVAEKPWQNFTFEGHERMDRATLGRLGYSPFRNQKQGYHFIIPPVESTAGEDDWFWSENSILKYAESLENLKRALIKPRARAIYAFVHLKYMHYPYLDTENMNESHWRTLSPKSQELLHLYRSNPDAYEVQLPMIQAMLNDFELAKRKFGADKVLSVAGLISDPARTSAWAKTPGFHDDLNLLRELYDLKMKHFDSLAEPILNLYGSTDLLDNTVVIFTGDHGEAFMEHGVLGHSVNVFEEMIRYPLFVKFPGSKGGTIKGQVNHSIMADVVKEILEGRITAGNFQEAVESRAAEYALSRSCRNDVRSVRWKSRWKLIKNVATDKNELYDLEKDPSESMNVADANPEIANRLEDYLLNHQQELTRANALEKRSKVCLTN